MVGELLRERSGGMVAWWGTFPDAWLDVDRVSAMLSAMELTNRSLVREFPKAKEAARKGQVVEIVDGKTGETFLLTAKPTRKFGELAAGAKGVFDGPADLSTREGFGD